MAHEGERRGREEGTESSSQPLPFLAAAHAGQSVCLSSQVSVHRPHILGQRRITAAGLLPHSCSPHTRHCSWSRSAQNLVPCSLASHTLHENGHCLSIKPGLVLQSPPAAHCGQSLWTSEQSEEQMPHETGHVEVMLGFFLHSPLRAQPPQASSLS